MCPIVWLTSYDMILPLERGKIISYNVNVFYVQSFFLFLLILNSNWPNMTTWVRFIFHLLNMLNKSGILVFNQADIKPSTKALNVLSPESRTGPLLMYIMFKDSHIYFCWYWKETACLLPLRQGKFRSLNLLSKIWNIFIEYADNRTNVNQMRK